MATMEYATTYDMPCGRFLAQCRPAPQGDVPEALRACAEVRRPARHQNTDSRVAVSRTILATGGQRGKVLDLAWGLEPQDRIWPLQRPGERADQDAHRAPLGVHPDPRTIAKGVRSGPPVREPSLCPSGPPEESYPAREHAPVAHCSGRCERPENCVRQWPRANRG